VEKFNSLIVRYSEIGLKTSHVRRKMEKILIEKFGRGV